VKRAFTRALWLAGATLVVGGAIALWLRGGSTVGGFFPAWRAARLQVVQALR
jgi:ABC-type lipoprotein release transport system permease subunit